MNTTTETIHHPVREMSLKWVASSSIMEASGAIATMALAIVGLASVFSITMASIATIVIGASILLEGGAFGAGAGLRAVPEAGGMSAEFLGGLAGIVLGILALLGVASQSLVSVAVLTFGASFLLSGLARTQFNWLASSAGSHVFVGLGAIVLGILAVIGLDPLTLVLVGLLSLGAVALFSGSAYGANLETHREAS
jgi:hypothetical protein